MPDQKTHWESIYQTKTPHQVSWYKPRLEKSIELIRGLGLSKEAQIIDIGAGASTLLDDLIAEGFRHITALDISSAALKFSKGRLGNKIECIGWIEADILRAELPSHHYDLWHDRALFHFLTEREDRLKYIRQLEVSLKPGGYLLMATFGPNGPPKCSGLPIVRYSSESLPQELGAPFQLQQHSTEVHTTPFDTTQEFLYCLFRKAP